MKKILSKEIHEDHKKSIADTCDESTVLIFLWTTESVDKADKYRKAMSDYFKDLSAEKRVRETRDSLQEIIEKVDASDMIYLPCGDTRLLFKGIEDAKADSSLRKYNKVIIGNSAGALTLCKDYVVLKGQDGAPITKVAHGSGLVDFGVSVHYKNSKGEYSGRSLDKELKALMQI